MAEAQRSPGFDFDPKSRASPSSSSSSSSFWSLNRSATMHVKPVDDQNPKVFINPTLYRAGSMNKFYNSIGSMVSATNSIKGKVKQLCSLFEKPKLSPQQSPATLPPQQQQQFPSGSLTKIKSLGPEMRVASMLSNYGSMNSSIRLPGTEDRIVVYCTSLRGIRRTYEDCYAVRMIFRGFRVWIDERDVSMDSAYKKELLSVLGEKNVTLPQVFIRGKHVGGAEVIKNMFETGELVRVLRGFPVREPGLVCRTCGDVRFVPCDNCNGSRKVFDEDEEALKRCPECNENGLIRCPDCGS